MALSSWSASRMSLARWSGSELVETVGGWTGKEAAGRTGAARLKVADEGFRAVGTGCPYSLADDSEGIGAEKGIDGKGL